ncbi:MAG: phage tail protein [Pontixanthobacter sp.]
MSGVVRKIGAVVGTIASIAAVIPGPHQPIAAAVAVGANLAVQVTKSGPTARGQIDARILGGNNPQPYLIGRDYSGGVQLHDVGWGGEVNDVENPYRFIAANHSCCGPVEALEAVQLDYKTANFSGTSAVGYYNDYLWRDFQLGARPEPDALQPHWSGAPRWGASHKLSSMAAIGYSLKWSKKGKRFAGGRIPVIGAIWLGVKVYDPRQDSTYPGGSGSCRIDDENTYVWAAPGAVPAGRNPALHSGQYAYGRYVNGSHVFGGGLGAKAIDYNSIVAWANVCDFNRWTVNGTIFEPAEKWNNLKRIAEAGAGKPVLTGGILRFDFQAPRSSLYTITKDDLADGPVSTRLGQGWENRHNVLVPRYRSEAHQWSFQQAGEVSVPEWIAQDGERKVDERQWDLVTSVDQATELAIYDLYQRRATGPIILPLKPHMRQFGPGDCVTLHEDLGVDPRGAIKGVVRRSSIDPVSGNVRFTFEEEDDAKHTAALGANGVAPTVVELPTSEDFDRAFGNNSEPAGYLRSLIATSSQDRVTITTTESEIMIGNHNRLYNDIDPVPVTGATLTQDDRGEALVPDLRYYLYYDDGGRSGGPVSWQGTTEYFDAQTSATNPTRHYGGYGDTDTVGGSGGNGGGSLPPGGGGSDPYDREREIQ